MTSQEEEDKRSAPLLFQPDVVAYRLGQVERQANHTEDHLDQLAELVRQFVAEMPAKYVPRAEHERAKEAERSRSGQNIAVILGVATIANGALATALSLIFAH